MVHLAFCPDQLRSQYIYQHPFDSYGIAFWKAQENFKATLELIRRDSLYHAKSEDRHAVALGVAVFTAGKSLCASMAISWRPAQKDGIDFQENRQSLWDEPAGRHVVFHEKID